MMFDTESQFSYLVKMKNFTESERKFVNDGFFLRYKSWKTLEKQLSEEPEGNLMLQKLRHNTLANYIKKIYMPITQHKECWLQE